MIHSSDDALSVVGGGVLVVEMLLLFVCFSKGKVTGSLSR